MIKTRFLRNSKGATLLEIIFGASLLAIVIAGIGTSQIYLKKQVSRASKGDYRKKTANYLISAIRSNPKNYQAHFKFYTTDELNKELDYRKLPLGWNQSGVIKVSECKNACFGRVGFVIQPLVTSPGLLKLTLRIYESGNKGLQHYDYSMIMGAN